MRAYRRKFDDTNYAHERIDGHEKLCTARHIVINRTLWRIEKAMWLWHGGWVVFLVLASQGLIDLSSLVKTKEVVSITRSLKDR